MSAQPALRSHHAPAVLTRRVPLADGRFTTLHGLRFPLTGVRVRVARLPAPEPLVPWCAREGVAHAIVGGFFVRGPNTPLGELLIGGAPVDHVPFLAPWDALRACVHVDGRTVSIARRPDLPAAPAGDLLQAGPLLVAGGERVVGDADDEGFTAGAAQFDSDISDGRHPRSALALTEESLVAVACDGRADHEAGMTLGELADTLLALGAVSAINLDGGGSSSLVHDGRLLNRPREQHGIELPAGRPISTAIVMSAC